MDFTIKERFGVFLIVLSFWYLINVKIFEILHPIFAIPGSVIFVTGLWFLLSPPASATSTYVPAEPVTQPVAQPVTELTSTPVPKPIQKPAKKSRSKPIKKTRKSVKETEPSEK